MRKREFLEAIIEIIDTGQSPVDPALLKEFAEKEIDYLDKRAERAREAAAKLREQGDALTDEIYSVLTPEYASSAQIAQKIKHPDASIARIQYRLNQLISQGYAEKTDITLGKRTIKGYRRR